MSEEKNKEEQLMKDYVHDMNNKLSVILGGCLMIKRTHCLNCKVIPLLDSINNASLGLSDLLLKCREKMIGSCSSPLRRIDLDEKFQVGSLLHTELLRLGTEMTLDVDFRNQLSNGCSISADVTIIESAKQFINNIFFNAKKANATRISVVAVEHDAYVAIHIIDNGNGMSAETLECLGLSIASQTSTGEGTRIAKKLALQEGAVAEWSSPGIGAGCCVTVRITKYKSSV